VVYRSGKRGYLTDLRISPTGDRIAFFDHPILYDDRGSVVVIDTAGKATTILVHDFWGLQGLAWRPDSRSILFAGSEQGEAFQVHEVRVEGGEPRRLLPSPGTLTLHDVSKDGRWLVTRDAAPRRVFVRAPGSAAVTDVSWLDYSLNPILAGDGKLIAFTDQSVAGGTEYSVMVGKTDGSPMMRVGKGTALAISGDSRWVLAVLPTAVAEYRLYPTGPGESRTLTWSGLESVSSVTFFPDSRSLFVCGNETRRAPRCYRSPLDASSIEPVTPDSVVGGLLRPDGLAAAVSRSDGVWVYPVPNGAPRLVPGLRDAIVSRWSPDGTVLWVQSPTGPKPHFEQVDVTTGRRAPLLTIETPADIAVFAIMSISLADDPRVYAYAAWSYTSELFTVAGLR
jgi:dipeptidyl aminopeptidase/acylaminoacyl peptidase